MAEDKGVNLTRCNYVAALNELRVIGAQRYIGIGKEGQTLATLPSVLLMRGYGGLAYEDQSDIYEKAKRTGVLEDLEIRIAAEFGVDKEKVSIFDARGSSVIAIDINPIYKKHEHKIGTKESDKANKKAYDETVARVVKVINTLRKENGLAPLQDMPNLGDSEGKPYDVFPNGEINARYPMRTDNEGNILFGRKSFSYTQGSTNEPKDVQHIAACTPIPRMKPDEPSKGI